MFKTDQKSEKAKTSPNHREGDCFVIKWIKQLADAILKLELLNKDYNMGIRFGPFDPLELTFQVMNTLMQKGLISSLEAKEIIRRALPPEMPEDQKESLLSSMIRPSSSPSTSASPSQASPEK